MLPLSCPLWFSLFSDGLQELTGTDWMENKQQPSDELLKIKKNGVFVFQCTAGFCLQRVLLSCLTKRKDFTDLKEEKFYFCYSGKI